MGAFLLLGAALITAAVTRAVFADDEHPACERYADRLAEEKHLLDFTDSARARRDYESELKRDPDAECAAEGLARLSRRSCKAAERLLAKRLLGRAEKVYVAELERDPGVECARVGLRMAADERCRVARRFVRRDRLDEAAAILKNDTVLDASAICPGALPPKEAATPAPPPTRADGDD